jgi:hypothetical protein
LTVDPASAVPLTTGVFAFAGEDGVVVRPLGAAGAVESSTYVSAGEEQAEPLPAASVAVA